MRWAVGILAVAISFFLGTRFSLRSNFSEIGAPSVYLTKVLGETPHPKVLRQGLKSFATRDQVLTAVLPAKVTSFKTVSFFQAFIMRPERRVEALTFADGTTGQPIELIFTNNELEAVCSKGMPAPSESGVSAFEREGMACLRDDKVASFTQWWDKNFFD